MPVDFERGSRFGPYAGSSFHERVIRAFTSGALQLLPQHEEFLSAYDKQVRDLVAQGFELRESKRILCVTQGNAEEGVELLCG